MLKLIGAKIFAAYAHQKNKKWINNPLEAQQKVFKSLLQEGIKTRFGKEHHFEKILTPNEFSLAVPVRDYEDLKPYVDSVLEGEANVLWPRRPLYYAKSSGTTSGAKYIPITKESMPSHVEAAKNAILLYIHETGNTQIVDRKMIFLQGSPVLENKNGVQLGRLSGIVAHYVPKYLQKNRLPSLETNCIEDWETKVNKIVQETLNEDMSIIAGIPSWVQMYFEKIIEQKGQRVGEIFKNFNLFIFGGVNYEPYRSKFEALIGRKVNSIELYPASEGFFAFQDRQNAKGMLLQLDSGMFYEFIAADTFFETSSKRLTLKDVKIGVNYVIIISTNAGLWAYNIGDTIQFTCLAPFRVIVSGRIKHFISAFGEHVIAKEVEHALLSALNETDISVSEFTVAPQIEPSNGLPYHEWFIEFETSPPDITDFASKIDAAMQLQNSYYRDLIQGKVLQPLVVTSVSKAGFQNYMKTIGKLGGQNKTPRLSNDRKIAEALTNMI